MGAALASAGDASSDNAPLPSLIDRAQRLVNRRTEETQRRDELAGRQAALTADLAEASAEERQIQEVWAAWEASWAEGTAALCLPRASPAETFTALEVLDEVLAALDRAKDFRARIEGIDRDALAYAAELASLCERLGLAHDGRGAEAIISDMHARLTRACTDMTKRAQLLDARKSERETLAGASETRETMTARLADLCLVAECGGPDGLTGAIEASRRLGGLHAELAVHERQLVEQGEGLTLVALEAEATDADADDLAARLADLDRQFNEADARRGELDRQIGDARTQLAGMAGGMQAAEAADEAQSALARLRPQVERYLRLRLAARLLREEIERYRKANESPVLARAGAIFADLTLGGFADIRTEYGDDDRPVLVGVRASDEVVPVAGMSDGTLDQLYLALRLATLERYLIANEPLPFVVDDILITFDDARAEAALRVLAEFSRLTQVIIFTHHSRVVDFAHASIGTGTFGVVRLGTTPVPRT
jgi:uncharacterized protein YhaN